MSAAEECARTVWLVRHGEREDVDPDWARAAPRPRDPGLSPVGIAQSRRLGQRLAAERVGHLFTSPFLRTVQTADLLARAPDLPIRVEDGLCEWLNPEWFPAMPPWRPAAELAGRFPRIEQCYVSHTKPRYPETHAEALTRAGEAARRLVEAFDGDLLMVGHGASVVGAVQGLVGEPVHATCPLCGLVKLAQKGHRWVPELTGDIAHLR